MENKTYMIIKSFSDLENAFIYAKLAKKLGLVCNMRNVFFGGIRIELNGCKEDVDKFNKIFNKGKLLRDWNVFVNIMSDKFISEIDYGK